MNQRLCANCGELIVRSDDGTRWLHETALGLDWYEQCRLFATPASEDAP